MKLPSVSVVFVSYKQERFVEEALRAALAQDMPEFELIIADDASPDGTWSVIERVLAGPVRPGIRVKTLRQPKNLGILGNFNAASAMATGEIFVCMAGDDVSYPARARKMAEAFALDASLRVVNCAYRVTDANGLPVAVSSPYLVSQTYAYGNGHKGPFAGSPVTGACASYHRILLDAFGPLPLDAGGEDVDLMFRALLLGRAYYFSEILMDYRQHGGNAYNYSTSSVSKDELVLREIKAAEANARFERQWTRDLAVALERGLIDVARARLISGLVDRHTARHALAALSLKVSPFSEWWPAALRLLRGGDFMKVFKLLLLRLFESRRTAHYKWLRKRKGQ